VVGYWLASNTPGGGLRAAWRKGYDIGERGRRPVLVLRACRLRRFLPCRGGRTRRRGGPRGLGWNRGDVRPRAQSPVAVAREDSRLGVEESQRFWLTSPTLGRVSGTVVQIAGEGMPKTRENRPLQPKPGGVKTIVMQRTGSSAVASRWPILPNGKIDRSV